MKIIHDEDREELENIHRSVSEHLKLALTLAYNLGRTRGAGEERLRLQPPGPRLEP